MTTSNGTCSSTTSNSKPSLRDYLTESLSTLPNIFPLGLTVLCSSPKRTTTLFPHTINPPKALEREYLITLHSTQPPSSSTSTSVTEETTPNGESSTTPQNRPILVVALHAYLYTLPTSNTSILYISKVDTSGYTHPQHPIPLTRTLLTSFLSFHLDPLTRPSARVQVSLFARSQSQYLFPNSAEAPGKRVSGGLRLCAWWKGVYEGVVVGLQQKVSGNEVGHAEGGGHIQAGTSNLGLRLRLRYLLPSYSEEEAKGMLGRSKMDLPTGTEWKYGPPFSRNLIGSTSNSTSNWTMPQEGEGVDEATSDTRLAWSIPALPDDPKTRFMDEIVIDSGTYTHPSSSHPPTSSSSLPRTTSNNTSLEPTSQEQTSTTQTQSQSMSTSTTTQKKDKNEAERKRNQGALDRVSVGEFWERMGFRQECSSGDVTGFFHLDSEYNSTTISNETKNGEEGKYKVGSNGISPGRNVNVKMDLPILIVDRIHQSLLNVDYGTEDFAMDGSSIWLKSTEALVKDEIGEKGWEACTATIAAKQNVQSVGIKRKDEGVTMLQIRKKPKKARPV